MQTYAKHHTGLLYEEMRTINSKLEECRKINQELTLHLLEYPAPDPAVHKKKQADSCVFIWNLPGCVDIIPFQEIQSPQYSTGPRGYVLHMALLKRETDTVVSVRLSTGLYDNLLPWPFKCKLSLHLVDQAVVEDRQHIGRQCSFDPDDRIPDCFKRPGANAENSPLYPLLVIFNEKLKEERYSRNNTLLLVMRVASYNVEDSFGLPEFY